MSELQNLVTTAQQDYENFKNSLPASKAESLEEIFTNRCHRALDKTFYSYFAEFNGMVFVSENRGLFYAMGFIGKAKRPDFHYFFKSFEALQAHIQKWESRNKKSIADKKERKQAQKGVI